MKRFGILSVFAILSLSVWCQTHWTKHPGNPVFKDGPSGEWDEKLDFIGSVILSGDTYMMWYSAKSAENPKCVGLASSEDGITWTREANNPVFEPGPEGSWDQDYVACGAVTMVDDTFHMWYIGFTGSWNQSAIGHAYSLDGIAWTRDTANPVLTLEMEGSIENGWIWIDEVVFDGNDLHMWYTAADMDNQKGHVGHATSTDGSKWTIDPSKPAILPGDPEDWDSPVIAFTEVVYDGSLFHMWYAGGNNQPSHLYDIGYASSIDGSTWNKYGGNPVLKKGNPGTWDSKSIWAGTVIDSAGIKYQMWYRGMTSTSRAFGYAESSPFVEIPDTAFLYALIEVGVDTNGDSLISYAEAEAVDYELDVEESGITDLTGIEAFINLDSLTVWVNELTDIDVSKNTKLLFLNVWYNELTELDVSANTELKGLYCPLNKLTNLDLSNNSKLEELMFTANDISSIDLSKNPLLNFLGCSDNRLSVLDVSENPDLEELWCSENQLSSLDLSNNLLLKDLNASDNELYNLDLSKNQALEIISLEGMPGMVCVTVWENPLPDSIEVNTEGSPNISFTTEYCPGIGIHDRKMTGPSIFPNPTHGLLTLDFGNTETYVLKIRSINGQDLVDILLEGPTHQIDLSSYQKGIYFITVRSKDSVTTRKIVKL